MPMIDFKTSRWSSAILLVAVALSTARLSASGLDDAKAGRTAFEESRYDDAIRLFTKAINSAELSNRDLAATHYGRGTAYGEKHLYDLAIADFGETIRILPDYAPAYYNRGSAYVYTKQYDLAERDLSRALELK